jgi:hypothetical protein
MRTWSPVGRVHAEVDVVGRDREGGCLERLPIGGEVAVVVATEGIGGQDRDPADQQREADQASDRGKDRPDHASGGPARALPHGCRAAVLRLLGGWVARLVGADLRNLTPP